MEKWFGKKWYVTAAFLLLTSLMVLYGFLALCQNIGLRWAMEQKEFHQMLLETAVLFVLFFLVCKLAGTKLARRAGLCAITGIFLWAHVVFVPVVVSGIYLVWVCLLGRFLRAAAGALERRGESGRQSGDAAGSSMGFGAGVAGSRMGFGTGAAGSGTESWGGIAGSREADEGIIADFLVGSCAVIFVFCLMSAAGIGDIPKLTFFVCLTGVPLFIWAAWGAYRGRSGKKAGFYRYGWLKACIAAFILMMFCIQAGRMNIAIDFDSRWYGLRSAYILNNGRGIYENMGAIGIVYSYSKGFEVLTLPLATLPSYSFVLSVNLWLCAGVLWLGYKIALFFMNRRYALLLAMALSAIPGIMNMGITAKADVITLLFQLIMVYYLLKFITAGKGKIQYLSFATSAFLVTWTLKPTALVFSSAIYGMSILYIIALYVNKRRKRKGLRLAKGRMLGGRRPFGPVSLFLPLILSAGSLAGIWARTVMLTGIPVTSVFSSIFLMLGYEMKYPYKVMKIPNSANGLTAGEWLSKFAVRLFQFLLKPVGEDMDHVILAWGGLLIALLLAVWAAQLFLRKSVRRTKADGLDMYLRVIFYPFTACCVISLAMLTQVDGNYFMLFYVLLTLYVMRLVVRQREAAVRRGLLCLSVPVLAFSVLVTCLTNWGFSMGFTPVSFDHPGYYDHQEAEHQRMVYEGNGTIWDIVASDPRNRLIAFGRHPAVLAFPCNVQSYEDIMGTWGNVTLIKTMDRFVEFMEYAKTDYVYVQAGYMSMEMRCYSLVRDMIEYGKLIPICYEEGNMLAVVDTEGEKSQNSEWLLTEFVKCYITEDINESSAGAATAD